MEECKFEKAVPVATGYHAADDNATNRYCLFFGAVDVLHLIPLFDFRRKQLRERFNAFIEALSKILGIRDIGAIKFLRKRYAYAYIIAGGGF
jgi:hypothetical protein